MSEVVLMKNSLSICNLSILDDETKQIIYCGRSLRQLCDVEKYFASVKNNVRSGTFPSARRAHKIVQNREIRTDQRGERYFNREHRHQTLRINNRNPSESKRKSPIKDIRTEKHGQKEEGGPQPHKRTILSAVSEEKSKCVKDDTSKISVNTTISEEPKQIEEPCTDYSNVSMELETDEEEIKLKDSDNNKKKEVETNVSKDQFKNDDITNTAIKVTETTDNTNNKKCDTEKNIATKNISQPDVPFAKINFVLPRAQKLLPTKNPFATGNAESVEISQKDDKTLKLDYCRRKGESFKPHTNTRKIPVIKIKQQKSELLNPQISTDPNVSTQPSNTRDPRLLKNKKTEDINSEPKILQPSSSSTPKTKPTLICNNTLVDPRINHIGYNIVKLHPIELKIPEFRRMSFTMRHKNLGELRQTRKPTRIPIRNRSSVCCGNLNVIRKFYNKPIAELMKFCCHVNIRRNECKNSILRKSPDISVSSIDTRKSYLVGSNSKKKASSIHKRDEKDSCISGCLLRKKNEETATSSVDMSSIDTNKSYIATKISENSISQANESKNDSGKNQTNISNCDVLLEQIKVKEKNHSHLSHLTNEKIVDSSKAAIEKSGINSFELKEQNEQKKLKDVTSLDDEPKQSIIRKRSTSSNERVSNSMPLLEDEDKKLSSAVTTSEILKRNEPTHLHVETPKISQSSVDEYNRTYINHTFSDSNKLLGDTQYQVFHKDPEIVPERTNKTETAFKRERTEEPTENKKMKTDTHSVKINENKIPNPPINNKSTFTNTNTTSTSTFSEVKNNKGDLCTDEHDTSKKLNLKNNSKAEAEKPPKEGFKITESRSPTACRINYDNIEAISNSSESDEYSLHIPEDTKSNSTQDTDMSSDELLKSLEETIESMTSADIPMSSEDADKYFQKELSEQNLTDPEQGESMDIDSPVDNSETKSRSVDENFHELSKRHAETSMAENSVAGSKHCGNSVGTVDIDYPSSSNLEESSSEKKVASNEGDERIEDDDEEELLLKIRVISNPEIKRELEEESMMNLKVDLFSMQTEIKEEDPESPSKKIPKSSPISTDTSEKYSEENSGLDAIERSISECNNNHISSEPSRNPLLNKMVCNGIDNQTPTSENTESLLENLIEQVMQENQTNDIHDSSKRSLLSPTLKTQVSCPSPSQTQRNSELSTVRKQNIPNITGEISRINIISTVQMTPSYPSKSDVTNVQVNKCPYTTMPATSNTCTSTNINISTIIQGNSTASNTKSMDQGKYSPTVNRNPPLTFVNENTRSSENERRMPQMLSIASRTPVEQGNGATYSQSVIETHLALNASKIVNAYIMSKVRGSYLVSSLRFLNQFRITETETKNVNNAILKMTGIFADCLLQNLRKMPATMRDPIFFVSYFMESLAELAKNEKAKPCMSYYTWELVFARSNEYEENSTLKYFKTFIENEVKALRSISGTPMTSEQYVRLKSQIFYYLSLFRTTKSNSTANIQNTDQYVVSQRILNRSNYTQMGTNSQLESIGTQNNKGSSQQPSSISSAASLIAPQIASLLIPNSSSEQQKLRPAGNITTTTPSVQYLPAYAAGSRKRFIDAPNTTTNTQLSNSSCKPPPPYNTFNIPNKRPYNTVTRPPNVAVSNVACSHPNCCGIEQSRTSAYMSSMGLSPSHPILSSRIYTNNLPNQKSGAESNMTNISSESPITTPRLAPNSFFNQTLGDAFNSRTIPSGVVAPIVSSRMIASHSSNSSTTAGSFPNPTTNKNIVPSGMSAPIPSSNIVPFYTQQNQVYGELNENTVTTSRPQKATKRASKTPENPGTIVNTTENVKELGSYFNTRTNGQSTPETISLMGSASLQGYCRGPNMEIVAPVAGTPESTKVAVQAIQNEREELKIPRNENLPLKTVVPIPTSILTPNTEIEKESRDNERRLSISPPRQPIPYPTPPISTGNVASENIEDTQLTNPSNDFISSNESRSTLSPHEEVKPSIETLPFNPTHSINLKNEPEDIIDLTWVEDDEIKLEPSDDGYTLTLDEPTESLLILHNRKCLCGEDAIYLCACNKVMYCSQECQFKDWENHQRVCPAGVLP